MVMNRDATIRATLREVLSPAVRAALETVSEPATNTARTGAFCLTPPLAAFRDGTKCLPEPLWSVGGWIPEPMKTVIFTALPGLPEVRAGDDLARTIVDAARNAECHAWRARRHAAVLLRSKEKDLFQ
jgi:hypothetical protein